MAEPRDLEWAQMRDRILDAVTDAVAGTDWGPPDSDPAVLSEVVVCMGWTRPEPGRFAVSYLRTGSTWSSQGLVRSVLESMEAVDGTPVQPHDWPTDEDD